MQQRIEFKYCVDYQELINLVAVAMRHKIPASGLGDGIYTHPSSTEVFNALLSYPGRGYSSLGYLLLLVGVVPSHEFIAVGLVVAAVDGLADVINKGDHKMQVVDGAQGTR